MIPLICRRTTLLVNLLSTISSLFSSSTKVYALDQTPTFQFNNNNNEIMRAWTCHGRNQREMVDRLKQAGIIRSDAVYNVMNEVDRKNYVGIPIDQAYQDTPISIGLGQTISAPHMHAHALEEIYPYIKNKSEPIKLLDVGCGSGYLTACMGRWVKSKIDDESSILGVSGNVYGIDIHDHLVQMTIENIKKQDDDLLRNNVVTVQVANGWEGLQEYAPYDAIHVGAAAAEFPKHLAQQLKIGGILIIPIGPQQGAQALYKIERIKDSNNNKFDPNDYRFTELLGVRYVPLVDQPTRN